MFKTLKTNWRDIVAFLSIGLLFSVVADWLIYRFTAAGWTVGVASTVTYLQGFSKFVGANIAASLIGVVGWKTVNAFGNNSFSLGWDQIPIWGKTLVYIFLMVSYGIMAAICFAGG